MDKRFRFSRQRYMRGGRMMASMEEPMDPTRLISRPTFGTTRATSMMMVVMKDRRKICCLQGSCV